MNINNLESCFSYAVMVSAKYVAVLVEMDGFAEPEIIINDINNAKDKLEYYKKAYNNDLTHKYSDGIRIIAFTYGDSFKDIEHDLVDVDLRKFLEMEHEEGFMGE